LAVEAALAAAAVVAVAAAGVSFHLMRRTRRELNEMKCERGVAEMTSKKLFTMASAILLLTCWIGVSALSAQDAGQKTFASPQDAGAALDKAVQSTGTADDLAVLGSSAASVVASGDEVQDNNNRDIFLKRYQQMNRWAAESNGTETLYIGADNWPFPIPLKKNSAGQWYFDTKEGSQEILYRRIGKNEMEAIQVMNALVDAQLEYFQQLHDGSTVHQYAQRIISEEGKQNGLYWNVAEGQTESPIGPLVAHATAQGYGNTGGTPEPFHGYYYHTIKAQGSHAPGGAKNYIVDGNMTGGFAFVAYPAEYRNSGVMTFLVDKNGVVFQKDLGANTTEIGKAMTAYNPDKTWTTTGEPLAEEPAAQ
jgi:Protein of unknown function (DUF2950)